MAVEEIKMFATRDGRVFKTVEEAFAHDDILRKHKRLSAKDLEEFLEGKNPEELHKHGFWEIRRGGHSTGIFVKGSLKEAAECASNLTCFSFASGDIVATSVVDSSSDKFPESHHQLDSVRKEVFAFYADGLTSSE